MSVNIVTLQDDALVQFLNGELESKDKELFLIVEKDIEREQKWLRGNGETTMASKSS